MSTFLRTRILVLLVLTCLALTRLSGSGQGRESRDWKRVRAGDLTILGNAASAELQRAATNIEQFRRTLGKVYPGMKLSFSVPTVLVVFKNEADFARFKPRDERGRIQQEVGGYFVPTSDVAYLVIPAGDARQAADYRVLFHEYAHALLHLNLRRLPAWVDEGMAEFYSTFEGDFRDGKSLIGRPPEERLQALRGRALLPLPQLLTSEGAYKFMRDRMTVGTFYAQSWALVHYLQVGDGGKRQGQLTRYLKLLEDGRPITDTFREAFGTTFDALQRELQSYVSRSTFQAALVDPGTTVLPTAVEPMTEADARFVQGDLLLKAGAAKDADDEFIKVLAAEPAHADARVGRAEVQRHDGKTEEAIASLQDIARANPTNVRVRNALVTALQGARRYEETLAAGREAVKLTDGSASTWFAMSVAELAQGRDAESNNALIRADALLPETHWYRARAYSAYELARHDVVVRDAATHLDRVRTDSDAAPYPAFLGALSYRKLNQPDQSMRILDRAAAAIVPGSWAEQVLLFLQDRSSAADFLRKAKTTGERTEAHAYIGIVKSIASDRAGAVEHLQWVQEKGARNFVEYRLAVAELEQLAGAKK
jgi:tetratricopeptide (TPR) repeat protein